MQTPTEAEVRCELTDLLSQRERTNDYRRHIDLGEQILTLYNIGIKLKYELSDFRPLYLEILKEREPITNSDKIPPSLRFGFR